MTRKLKVVLKLPPVVLSPNCQKGWKAKMGPKKEYREHAKEEAMVAAYEQGVTEHFKSADVGIDWYDKQVHRRDELNVPGYLKAGFDGLQDAGIVEDDRHFRIGRIQILYDKANPRVELNIRETP